MSVPDKKRLKLELSTLFDELYTIVDKWEELGQVLSVDSDKITSLKLGGTSEDSLREILRYWLEFADNQSKPSWQVLIAALEAIDQTELAETIRTKYTCQPEEQAGSMDASEEVKEKTEVEVSRDLDGQGEQEAQGSASVGGDKDVSHVYDVSWSKLSREDIIDKVKGVIYGQAIGDALGLATEFMSPEEAKKYYGKDGPNDYSVIVQDFHRSRWQKGDWTDDTDQMLLILQMIVKNNGRVDKLDFAQRILTWMQHGFEELGDIGGMGIGMTVHSTLTHPTFLSDPHGAAREVWERSGKYLAANGAIMRTSILGALHFNDIAKVVANTTEIAQTTHADPRCAASCIAVTTAIALMLKGDYDPSNKAQLKSLINRAIEEANSVLEHKDQQKEMKKHINDSLKGLQLDERKSIGYTFKALGAGFYGLRTAQKFKPTVLEVIMAAGDADSNAAVCGALMGCKFGFHALPEDLLQFVHREWLDKQVDGFLKTIGLL